MSNDKESMGMPKRVFVGGKLMVSDGRLVFDGRKKKATVPSWMKKTIHLKNVTREDFVVRPAKKNQHTISANTIHMLTEIITRLGSQELTIKDGNVLASKDKDVWKVAAFDRMNKTGKKKTVGFLENFGADIGAFSCTWSFHENDMIVIGSNESDMAMAANALIKSQGGMAVVKDGNIDAIMPLELAGIISTKPFEQVSFDFESITSRITDSGCKFSKPHLIPLFLPFLALPSIRIIHTGIIDVKSRSFIKPLDN
jgi:adenine deaminase